MFKVAIVGHSQVPKDFKYEGTEVRTYRAPGGKAVKFENDERLNKVLEWKHDLTFLWIGSNDIDPDTAPWPLAKKILEIAQVIKVNCESEVIIVEIENRENTSRSRITNEQYKKVKRGVNRHLLKDKVFLSINFGATFFTLARDGVHFETEAKDLVRQKFVRNIRKYKEKKETSSVVPSKTVTQPDSPTASTSAQSAGPSTSK